MVGGANGLVGLHVHKPVVVAYALDNDPVTTLHPPMVVQTVRERQFVNVAVKEMLVLLVRKQFNM